MPDLPTPRRRSSAFRRGVVGVLLVAVVAAVACVAWAAFHLEHRWVKPLVVRTVRTKLGLVVDYRALSIDPFGGHVRGRGLSLAQPPKFVAHTPTFVKLDAIDADLGMWSLLRGRVRVPHVALAGLEVVYVSDETTDSVSLLFPEDPNAPKEPETPLSHSFELLRGLGVDVGELDTPDVRLRYLELEHGAVVRRVDVDALALRGHFHERDELDVALHLSAARKAGRNPTRWTFSQVARAASADGLLAAREASRASGSLTFDATIAGRRETATLSIHGRLDDRAGLPVPRELVMNASLDLEVEFEPEANRTRLALRRLSLFDGVVAAQLSAIVEDREADTLKEATGELDVAFSEPPIAIDGVDAKGVRAHAVLDHAQVSPRGVLGRVDARASAERLGVLSDGRRGGGENLTLTLATEADVPFARGTAAPAPGASHFDQIHVELGARTFSLDSPPEEATVRGTGLAATVRGPGLLLATPSARAGTPTIGTRDVVDELTLQLEELSLTQGTGRAAASATLSSTEVRAEGEGLVGAFASSAPASGKASITTGHLVARRAAESVDLGPVDVAVDLHDFLLEARGLFGLGGRADVHAQVSGNARSGSTNARVVGLDTTTHLDFDRSTIEGTLPVDSLSVRDGASALVALRGTDLRFSTRDPLGLAPPGARGRFEITGKVAHVDVSDASMSLPRISVLVSSEASVYTLTSSATVAQLSVAETRIPGAHDARASGTFDLHRLSADLEAHVVAGSGEHAPRLDAELHGNVDARTSELAHRTKVSVANLDELVAHFVPAGGHARIARASLTSSGRWTGLLARPTARGTIPALATDLPDSLEGTDEQELILEGVDVLYGDSALRAPKLELHARVDAHRSGPSTVELRGVSETLTAKYGHTEATFASLSPTFTLTVADLSHPDTATIRTEITADRITQNEVREYPMTDVRLTSVVDLASTGITVRDFLLENRGAHGAIRMTGAYERDLDASARVGRPGEDAIQGREALALGGVIEHDVGALVGTSFAHSASGTLRVPFQIESGDLRAYHAVARVVADSVSYTSPDQTLAVENLDGEFPIDETVLLQASGPSLDPGPGRNPVSRERFPDVQPFLDRDAYVTADRVVFSNQVLGPLAGNVRVAGTTLSVDRLHVGYRGGVVTGQLEADLHPGAASIALRGNATRIHTSTGGDEVLDANLALRFLPQSLALDGTVQLVRLSTFHLGEILDAVDPFREDADMNTIRSLLRLGYPKTARLRAADGLLSLDVELGGIARAVRIDPIRAIPIAPLLDEYLGPIVDRYFPRDTSLASP